MNTNFKILNLIDKDDSTCHDLFFVVTCLRIKCRRVFEIVMTNAVTKKFIIYIHLQVFETEISHQEFDALS